MFFIFEMYFPAQEIYLQLFFLIIILCIPFLFSLLAPIICKLNILNLILALTVSLELLSKVQFSISDF